MEPLLPLAIRLPAGRGSILQELHRQLRTAITDGRLQPGHRLPSTRALAATYGVSRNTAVATYDRLLSEGYIATHRGSGTRVADSLPRTSVKTLRQKVGTPDRRVTSFWRTPALHARTPVQGSAPSSFQVGVPDVTRFPFEIWRRLSNETVRTMASSNTSSADPQGSFAYREAIAQHVSYTRAVACGPDDIVVTSGAQQAFDLLSRILVTPNRTGVALEDPGYARLRTSFEAAGARITPVPVDDEGIVVEQVPHHARVICVTPSHQFPRGCALSAARRTALLELAQAQGAVIVEDDYDGEFRFTDRPLDALQTLDRSESVFYVGTFSKSLLPTLRLGYVVTPAWARAALVTAKQAADGGSCAFMQATVAAMIRGGHLARHVRNMQRIYCRRRQLLLDGVQHDLVRWLEPLPSCAGLHIAAALTTSRDDQLLATQARQQGISVLPLSGFSHRRHPERGLVFGFGAIEECAVPAALRQLHQILTASQSKSIARRLRSASAQ